MRFTDKLGCSLSKALLCWPGHPGPWQSGRLNLVRSGGTAAGSSAGRHAAGPAPPRPSPGNCPFRGFPFSFTLLFALAAVFHNLWMAFIRPSVRSCRCHGEGWRVALIWSPLPGRGSASLVPEFSPLTRLRRRAGDSPLGPVRALPP